MSIDNVQVIDWRYRDLQKIYSPEEGNERAAKALSLVGITIEAKLEAEAERLKAASSYKKKPTSKLKGASTTRTRPILA